MLLISTAKEESDESESEYSSYAFCESESGDEYCFSLKSKLRMTTVKVNYVKIEMVIDSGASCNIINSKIQNKLNSSGVKFEKSNHVIHPYASPPIKASVQADVIMCHNNQKVKTQLICLESNAPPLLGRKTAEALKLLKLENVNLVETETVKLEKKFPGLTRGIGKLKGTSVKLHVNQNVPPVARKSIRVPFHLRDKVEAEIKRLEQEDIIEKVTGPTEWVSPVVIAEKPKSPSEVRICVDMREPNKAIMRTRHVTPTLDELICDLRHAQVFSKIDLRSGYHQLDLHPSSRSITTFATHCGLFRYKRLIFGVNAAAEIFQHAIQTVISDIKKNAQNVSDDIIILGRSQEEHAQALTKTLERLHESGLTINAKKCEFNKEKISFFGHVFSKEGISPDPEKVKALQEAKKKKMHLKFVRSSVWHNTVLGLFQSSQQ